MKHISISSHYFVSILVAIALCSQSFQSVGADSPPPAPKTEAGLRFGTNPETGMLSFIGADPQAPQAALSSRPVVSALAMIEPYKTRLGLTDVYQQLKLENFSDEGGRQVSRYQQIYQGIPVMAGELVVNAADGRMLSISGEMSPGLALDPTPVIDAAQASQNALASVAKGYQMDPAKLKSSPPALWIYDARLLHPDGSAPALVWRMEVTPVDGRAPVNELVLVDARRGSIALNFNQVDTVWEDAKPNPASPKTEAAANKPLAAAASFGPGNWFVAARGSDSNSCAEPALPCLTINGAIARAASGNTINVAVGKYTPTGEEVVLVNKSVTITGGWDDAFSAQSGVSTIDGGDSREGVRIVAPALAVNLSRFIIQRGIACGLLIEGADLVVQVSETIFRLNVYGICNQMSTLGLARSAVINSSITGILNYYGNINFSNSTISGTSGFYQEGGNIRSSGGKITIQYSTIVDDRGADYGIDNHGSLTLLEIGSSILAGNGPQSCAAEINSLGFNVFQYRLRPCTGTIVLPTDKLDVDPKLGQLLSGGYHPLLSGSVAIGAANPANCLAIDQRGVARPQGAGCDIGAFEFTSPGAAASIALQDGSDQLSSPILTFPKPLTVAVSDSNGSPVSGVTVTFMAPPSGPSGIFTDNLANSTSAVTDINGIAVSANFTANDLSGVYSVAASAIGAVPASFNLENAGHKYVSNSGSDANSCAAPEAACLTINAAIGKASADEIIKVAVGTYTGTSSSWVPVVTISKNVYLSGGWNPSFSAQVGSSTIDGQRAHSLIVFVDYHIRAVVDRFNICNGGKGVSNYGDLIISNSAIHNNSTGTRGGGISSEGGKLDLNNVIVSENTASDYGGGIYIERGIVNINNSTITRNQSLKYGGGIINGWSGWGGVIYIQNTILADNVGSDFAGSIDSRGYNLTNTNTGSNSRFHQTSTDLVGSWDDPIYPRLTPMLAQDGSTYTLALKNDSPAIDAGNPAVPGSDGTACLRTDQSGTLRPVGARCDIGAYEGVGLDWSFVPLSSTYTANSGNTLPGVFLCDQTQPGCTGNVNPDADAAQRYALGMDTFLYNQDKRDGINGDGMTIVSTVNFCDPAYPCPFANAFWSGSQMVYGAGYPLADDVVGHELAHGVTQYESGLFYYYQSGAIDESFSDIWGELYDQSNGQGNDAPSVKWLMGEDAPGGAIRSMSNPSAAPYLDPDAINSALYYTGWQDNGGVHTNSGVNNKAAYLMVEGGTFNGRTVSALGAAKTLDIYYEVQTNLLTSGSDYGDLYYGLYQGCLNLLGVDGITFIDCQQVRSASDAVAMNSQPKSSSNFNTDAPFCDLASTYKVDTFLEDFEVPKYDYTWKLDTYHWGFTSPFGTYAHSGKAFLYGNDTESYINSPVSLKSMIIPAKAYLHFAHSFGFDYGIYNNTRYYFDGGVLEYSTDNGVIWKDAKPLMQTNAYNGMVTPFSLGNTLRGQAAFVGDSHGYISTRLDLATLAGKSVSFRWRLGTDKVGYFLGWFIDDVRIYTCQPLSAAPVLSSPANASISSNPLPVLNWSSVPGASSYQIEISNSSSFANKQQPFNAGPGVLSYQAGPLPSGTYYWHVHSLNSLGLAGMWSATRSFIIDLTPPAVPVLNLPINSAVIVGTPSFSWRTSATAVRYQFEYDDDPDFSSPAYTSNELTTLKLTPPAIPLGAFYWHARARDAYGNWSAWSLSRKVTINPPVPGKPTLASPGNALVTNDNTPELAWWPVAYGNIYQLEISKTSNFNIKTQTFTGAAGVLAYTAMTLPDGLYYWHVRAVNVSSAAGAWSVYRSFTVNTTPPAGPVLSKPVNGASTASRYQFQYDNDADFSSPVCVLCQ